MASSPSTTSPTTIQCSKGEDEAKLIDAAQKLITTGKWQLTNEGRGLERTFRFKTFTNTWDFMNTVAKECKEQKHHPEWSNVYNKTHILWTTHRPKGLSSKDVHMARFCDDAAVEHGEVVDGEKQGQK